MGEGGRFGVDGLTFGRGNGLSHCVTCDSVAWRVFGGRSGGGESREGVAILTRVSVCVHASKALRTGDVLLP